MLSPLPPTFSANRRQDKDKWLGSRTLIDEIANPALRDEISRQVRFSRWRGEGCGWLSRRGHRPPFR